MQVLAYESAGIPYCRECGDLLHVDDNGNPLCPILKAGCSRNVVIDPPIIEESKPEIVEPVKATAKKPHTKKKVATPEA
jgi:hypothetical protein